MTLQPVLALGILTGDRIARWAGAVIAALNAIARSGRARVSLLVAHVWLEHYNYRRPHGALSHQPPAARLAHLTGNNLIRAHSTSADTALGSAR